MTNWSIKKKLTLWYSLVIFLISTTLFIFFYLLTSKDLLIETDRSLATHTAQITANVVLNTTNIHDSQTKNILDLSEKEVPGIFVEIVDTQGFTVEGRKSAFRDLAIQSIKDTKAVYKTTRISGYAMRIIAAPITGSSAPFGAVIMGHPMDVYQKTLSQIRIFGIGVMLFLILPSITLGYWLSKTALDPVTKLSMDLNKINSENLYRTVGLKASSYETTLLINNFNALLARLNNSFKLERQFLGEMAHEIKTPLAVIKTNAEVTLSKVRSSAEYQDSLKQILDHTDKLTRNLLSLLDFAWSQNSDVKEQFTKVDLTSLLKDLLAGVNKIAQTKNIELLERLKDDISVKGKEEKLYQAFYNIVDNAIKFTPSKGRIYVELTAEDTKAVVKITDTGIGMEAAKIKNIFNRFYRTEQTKNIAGHGLGLAIAQSIISAHDGTIDVQSTKDLGSTFTVILPLLSS